MDILEILKAVLFGIVQGVTEWLPISSTGHMILLEQFVKLKNITPEFWSLFLVVIQLGSIIAVVILFWNKIFPFNLKKENGPVIKTDIFVLWFKVIVACIPAALIGVFGLDDIFEEMFYDYIPVAIALITFGILFIIVEKRNVNKNPKITELADISYMTAFLIGIFQLIAAIFPGTSRSGATIVGALMIGVSRTIAAEFTFILAIPVMFGASLLKVVKFVKAGAELTNPQVMILAVGTIVAFLVSLLVIRFLMNFVKKHNFIVFGWYRIILGSIIIAYAIAVH